MRKNLILTSLISLGVVCTANAAPTHTADTFPNAGNNEYMQEDYTYTSSANFQNMGVYSGNVRALAIYQNKKYNIDPGMYLVHGTETGTQCLENNFCSGLTGVEYDEDNDQGLTSCSTLDNGAYPNSDVGARANTDCYRACSGNVTVAHATGVTGNEYYGGVSNCSVTGCENGYHQEYSNSVLASTIGNVSTGGTYSRIDEGKFSLTYGDKGTVVYDSICSDRGGTNAWIANGYDVIESNFVDNLTDKRGQEGAVNCYCGVATYTPNGGETQTMTAPWVFMDSYETVGGCSASCQTDCISNLASTVPNDLQFRAAVLNRAVAPGETLLATCEPNQITITWDNASQVDIDVNNAGQCVYGGDLRTPRAAEQITGKEFMGWKFEISTPEQLP